MKDLDKPLRRLDKTLPSDIDRRTFLAGSIASLVPALAGCLGDDDDDDDDDHDEDLLNLDTSWRQPWRAEPTWSVEFLAEHEGHWTDAGILPPTVTQGDGSPDTARRVGTDENELGTAEIASTIGGWAEGQESYVFGVNKQWNLLGLMWPEGRIEDHTDLEGRTVLQSSPFAEATWPVLPDQLDLDGDTIDTQFVEEEVTPGLLAEEEGDVVYGSLDTFGFLDGALDADLQAHPLSEGIAPVIGFPFLVSADWYDRTDDADEYLAAVIEGYSEAAHWAALNPDETIDFIIDVEPDLAALDEEDLEIQMQWAITLKTGGPAEENGVGYMDPDLIESSIEIIGPAMADDPDDVPDPDDVILEEPMEMADLTTFSDDEWDEVTDYIGSQRALFP